VPASSLSRALRLGLTGLILVMLVLFARRVNWHDTWMTMRSASLPLLAAAAVVNILSIVVKAVRWWVFLRPVGARSLPLAMRATFAGGNMVADNWGLGGFETIGLVGGPSAALSPTATLDQLALSASSPLKGKATDGKDVGADIAAVKAATAGVVKP